MKNLVRKSLVKKIENKGIQVISKDQLINVVGGGLPQGGGSSGIIGTHDTYGF
jgi:hypothetical protein